MRREQKVSVKSLNREVIIESYIKLAKLDWQEYGWDAPIPRYARKHDIELQGHTDGRVSMIWSNRSEPVVYESLDECIASLCARMTDVEMCHLVRLLNKRGVRV